MILRYLLVLITAVMTACAQAPVAFDYDASAKMPAVKSFALVPPNGPQYQSLDNNRIEAALRKQLGARNLQEVAKDQADIWVAYRVEQERKLEESGVSFGVGFGTGNVGLGVGTGPKAKEIIEGMLIVDAVDPQRQQVVWTARAQRYLRDSMQPEQRDELINTLVSAMLVNFPPQAK